MECIKKFMNLISWVKSQANQVDTIGINDTASKHTPLTTTINDNEITDKFAKRK
jgi:hypothetical protein